MITEDQFRQYALSLPETMEGPHFANRSFTVKKKIFATLNVPEKRATLRFSPELQDVFCALSNGAIYPVPNKWGKHGWTHLNLETAPWELCEDALQNAWWEVAPQKLRALFPELNAEERGE